MIGVFFCLQPLLSLGNFQPLMDSALVPPLQGCTLLRLSLNSNQEGNLGLVLLLLLSLVYPQWEQGEQQGQQKEASQFQRQVLRQLPCHRLIPPLFKWRSTPASPCVYWLMVKTLPTWKHMYSQMTGRTLQLRVCIGESIATESPMASWSLHLLHTAYIPGKITVSLLSTVHHVEWYSYPALAWRWSWVSQQEAFQCLCLSQKISVEIRLPPQPSQLACSATSMVIPKMNSISTVTSLLQHAIYRLHWRHTMLSPTSANNVSHLCTFVLH